MDIFSFIGDLWKVMSVNKNFSANVTLNENNVCVSLINKSQVARFSDSDTNVLLYNITQHLKM